MMATVASAAALTVTLAGIRPFYDELAKLSTLKIKKILKRNSASRTLSAITSRAKFISEVKTLLDLDTPTSISDFYSPQTLTIKNNPIDPEKLSASNYSRVVVLGVAGQGKSILFRYLALRDMGERILPLFIELRNFQHTQDIFALLNVELESMGFAGEKELLEFLMALHPS